jgi:predicted amidophosphoribosyltransferase
MGIFRKEAMQLETPPNSLLKVTLPIPLGSIKESYHVAFYHAARGGYQDRISKCILDFNDGQEPQVSRWIRLASPMITRQVPFDCVVTALRSKETVAEPASPLRRLGEAIAKEKGVPFAPERLRKGRVTAELRSLVGKAARQKELSGVFSFDGNGLPPKARILVVDDVMVTGATAEAIEGAIHTALPEAEVFCFVLGRAHGLAPNSHLNPEYFTSERDDKLPILEPPRQNTKAREHNPVSLRHRIVKNLTDRFPRALRRADTKEKSRFWIYVSILAVVFLLVGSLIPLGWGKKSSSSSAELPEMRPVVDGLAKSAEPKYAPPVTKAAPVQEAPKMRYPLGTVVVPGVGLRTKPTVGAPAVPKVALRNGEQVSVLKRHSPGNGPPWVQVQTKSGKAGWVFASLIKESKAKPR